MTQQQALQKTLGFGVELFIEKAIEGGWDWNDTRRLFNQDPERGIEPLLILLDPLAWRAVGKAEGWRVGWYGGNKKPSHYQMLKLIDALNEQV